MCGPGKARTWKGLVALLEEDAVYAMPAAAAVGPGESAALCEKIRRRP
jgi:hypothetical protein